MNTVTIAGQHIGPDARCFVIAEIGHNHMGRLDLALELVDRAAEAGVSAVKFQRRHLASTFTPAQLEAPHSGPNSFGPTYGAHRAALELPLEALATCRDRAHQHELAFMVTPFDAVSAAECMELGVDAFKVASGDLTHHALLKQLARYNKPLAVSTGAATLEEIEGAVAVLAQSSAAFVLLHAVAAYPSAPEQLNLNRIPGLQHRFPEVPVGYSGHDLGLQGALTARSLGAHAIEKHFTLDPTLKGTDQAFSHTPEEMALLVQGLANVDAMLGQDHRADTGINPFETAARVKMGKSIVAARDLPEGHVLTEVDVCFRSPGGGLAPSALGQVLGQVLNQPLQAFAPITSELLHLQPTP